MTSLRRVGIPASILTHLRAGQATVHRLERKNSLRSRDLVDNSIILSRFKSGMRLREGFPELRSSTFILHKNSR